ncbi:MAG: hypothetical protein J0I84_20320, partial [Terrimonas sp.]|nr:hypothetical protein [Terrimonas sp.]
QKEVAEKISPDLVLGTILKRINSIKATYTKNLKRELENIQDNFEKKFGKHLNIPEDAADISVTDINAVKTRLFSSVSSESYREGMDRYQNLISNSGTNIDTLKAKDALYETEKVEALQKAYQKISDWREKFENNPTVKKLQSHLPFTPENYKAYLKEPGKLTEVIKKYGSLTTLQNLFLNLTKLDLGQNAVENGQFSVQHLMNTGINASFLNNKIGAGLIAGVNNNPNNWLQGGLNSFVTNEYSSMAGITLSTGSNSKLDQSISVNLFSFSNPSWAEDPSQYLQSSYLPTASRKEAVMTLHSGVKISEGHEVSFDISKSFGSFQNLSETYGTETDKTTMKGLLSNEGRSNYAMAFDYRGLILKTDVQLLFKSAGLGYNNPGNMFMRRGETQVQAGVARKLFRQRLIVKYKTDYRNQHFDPEKKYTYSTFSNKINASWKFRKNSRAGLSYQQSNYTSLSPLGGKIKGISNILQADGTYRFRINRKFITNTEILTFQKMALPVLNGEVYGSRSVFFAHTTTVPVNKSFVMISAMINHSNSSDYYFNTSSVSTEAS